MRLSNPARSTVKLEAVGTAIAFAFAFHGFAHGSETVWVDVPHPGLTPTYNSSFSNSVSNDGRFVAFASSHKGLVTGLPDALTRIYVRDVVSGTTECLTPQLPGQVSSYGASEHPRISGDGRFVVFESLASLVPSDTNTARDVYLYDRQTAQIECISVNAQGTPAVGRIFAEGSQAPPNVMSSDGRYVAFYSSASLAPNDPFNTFMDVYLRDRTLQQTILISVTPWGTAGNDTSIGGALSASGEIIVFKTWATNLADTTGPGMYAKNLVTGAMTRVDVDSSGSPLVGGNVASMALSADGKHVALEVTGANPSLGDPDVDSDIYVVDLMTHAVEIVSRGPTGFPSNAYCQSPDISADGRYVTYTAYATNIVLWDINPQSGFTGEDIVLHDRATHRSTLINVSNAVAQSNSGNANMATISDDGRFISFRSTPSGLGAPSVPSNFIFVRDRVGFAQMGFGIAGTNGIPSLTGTGSTATGGSGQIDLAGAAPSSLAILLVSLDHGIKAPTSGPLKFSVLVTAKPILALSLMTNASGSISLPYSLPPSVAIYPEAYMQCAIADSAAPLGAALSNALQLGFE